MWFIGPLLFIFLQPGILFTFPPDGGITTIVVHAFFFAALMEILTWSKKQTEEGFQSEPSTTPEERIMAIMNKKISDRPAIRAIPRTDDTFTKQYTKLYPYLHPPPSRNPPEGFKSYTRPTKLGDFSRNTSTITRKSSYRSIIPSSVLEAGLDLGSACFEPAIQCEMNNKMHQANADCTLGGDYEAGPTAPQVVRLTGNEGTAPLTT
jgi:hypothetical protein